MHIIPAIDIIGGKCVRLTQGDYAQKTEYGSDPVEIAKRFEDSGIRRLHLVDLDGAKARTVVNIETLKAITKSTKLSVDFGGGIKQKEDLDKVLQAGAKQVTAGSIAASDPDEVTDWIAQFGPERIILGADVLDRKIMVSGWQKRTDYDLFEYLEFYFNAGVREVICTDISKDGLLQGPSFELYREIGTRFKELRLIASGGVSKMDDLVRLAEFGVYGAIVGKAYYEGKISLTELNSF